jgi:hypothetical protein
MQVDALFEAHKDVLTEESYRGAAVQRIQNNIRWLASNGAAVCAWLRTSAPPTVNVPGLQGTGPAHGPIVAPAGVDIECWAIGKCWRI